MASPSWSWRLEGADGGAVEGLTSESFPSQADAESWIGEAWAELADRGVDQVVLCEGEREVYGPMSLHPPD